MLACVFIVFCRCLLSLVHSWVRVAVTSSSSRSSSPTEKINSRAMWTITHQSPRIGLDTDFIISNKTLLVDGDSLTRLNISLAFNIFKSEGRVAYNAQFWLIYNNFPNFSIPATLQYLRYLKNSPFPEIEMACWTKIIWSVILLRGYFSSRSWILMVQKGFQIRLFPLQIAEFSPYKC